MKITAKREDFQGKLYTSARINTQDKFEFTYGRVEMRAKLPNWEGMWPAFWLLGAIIDEIGWPNCGELDILDVIIGVGYVLTTVDLSYLEITISDMNYDGMLNVMDVVIVVNSILN